jgi:hypothetical protein
MARMLLQTLPPHIPCPPVLGQPSAKVPKAAADTRAGVRGRQARALVCLSASLPLQSFTLALEEPGRSKRAYARMLRFAAGPPRVTHRIWRR